MRVVILLQNYENLAVKMWSILFKEVDPSRLEKALSDSCEFVMTVIVCLEKNLFLLKSKCFVKMFEDILCLIYCTIDH